MLKLLKLKIFKVFPIQKATKNEQRGLYIQRERHSTSARRKKKMVTTMIKMILIQKKGKKKKQ